MPVMVVVCCKWFKSTSVRSWSQHCSRDKSGAPSSHSKLKASCLHWKHTSSFSRVSTYSWCCLVIGSENCKLDFQDTLLQVHWAVNIFSIVYHSDILLCHNTFTVISSVQFALAEMIFSHSNQYLTSLRCSAEYWQCSVPPSGHNSGVGQVEDCWRMHYQCTLTWSCGCPWGTCHTMVPADWTGVCVCVVWDVEGYFAYFMNKQKGD